MSTSRCSRSWKGCDTVFPSAGAASRGKFPVWSNCATASPRAPISRPISPATGASPSTRKAFFATTRRWIFNHTVIPRWSVRTRPGISRFRVHAIACPGMTALRSPVPPVDRRHRDLGEVDAVDATDVQRHHLGAVGPHAAGEHVDTAIDAQLMADGVLVEQIFLQILVAGAELKALRRQEREMQPLLGADRAVARRHHGKIAGAFEPNLAAMAAAGEGFLVGHHELLAVAILYGIFRQVCGADFVSRRERLSNSDQLVDSRALSWRQRSRGRRQGLAGIAGAGIDGGASRVVGAGR